MIDFEAILPQLAAKADVAACAQKTDLERFATKEDLERFATKTELRDGLEALKAHMAERYATKADLREGLDGLKTHMLVLHEAVLSEFRLLAELVGGRGDRHEQRLNDHDRRLRRLEEPRRAPRG